jgi:hypothetical protein
MTEPAPASSPTEGPSARRHRRDTGGLVFGLLLLGLGIYFLLKETLGLVIPDIGELWPVFVIALGAWILLSAMRGE